MEWCVHVVLARFPNLMTRLLFASSLAVCPLCRLINICDHSIQNPINIGKNANMLFGYLQKQQEQQVW